MSFHVPGRLRFAVEGLLRNGAFAEHLRRQFEAAKIPARVEISHLTGKVLVRFSPADHAVVRDHLDRVFLFETGIPDPDALGRDHPHEQSGKTIKRQKRPPNTGGTTELTDPFADTAWHALSASRVVRLLSANSEGGLTSAEAQRRRNRDGPNALEERPPTDQLALFARQFASLPVGLLIGASAVSLLTGGVADAVVTLLVVGANAVVGYATESGSDRVIRAMTRPQSCRVPVWRDGALAEVNVQDIVAGDLLKLSPNTVIAADARVVQSDALYLNEALLTGESEPVEKRADAQCDAATILAERASMVHTGSFVATGEGRAVVVATGPRTQAGQIAAETQKLAASRTPLERDLEDLGTKLAIVSLGACGAFFFGGLARGRASASMFKSAIALAVAAVPEGLPVTATTTLALGLRDLRKKGVVVRRLEAVEGLGSLETVCFDKTGTLTENRMRLERVGMGLAGATLGVGGAVGHGGDAGCGASEALQTLGEIAILCSEVSFKNGSQGREPIGSSTEAALAAGAIKLGVDPVSVRARWPLVRLSHRRDGERYMRSLHRCNGHDSVRIAVKGDPHQVLDMCTSVMEPHGRVVPLTSEVRRRLAGGLDDLAGRGLRVLGFAQSIATAAKTGEDNRDGLTWIGAAGLKDPIRSSARDVVAQLRRAGIRTVMITGDQAATAQAIAEELRLNGDAPIRVLDSRRMADLEPALLVAVARSTDVFARISPSDKLRIVQALQAGGHIVGMSGDGFNDAPALKAANIAIAVGRDSAMAARDVADIIVGEGDLAAIADGVEQGRTILSNIRKSVHYMISTNLSEIIVLLAESLSANDQLETPLELLWLNLVTDILPGLGLAMEPPERRVMDRPPRPSDEPLLTARDLTVSGIESLVISTAVLGAHGFALARYGPGPQTRTVTFLSLVTSQLLHALPCRFDRFHDFGGRTLFGNPRLNAALLAAASLQVVAVASPGLRRMLGIAAPTMGDLVTAGLAGLASFSANEALLAMRPPRGR